MEPWAIELIGDAANVVLGWGLGLLSALGIKKWEDRNRLKGVKVAIGREFSEIGHRLVALVHKLSERTGGLNRDLLEWVLLRAREYEGPNPRDGIVAGTEGLLRHTDAELAALAAELQRRAEPQFVPAESAPYATAAIADLRDSDADYSTRVLDVLAHLRMLDEARENGLYYLRLTFIPGVSLENYDRAVTNLEGAYAQMARRGRIVVDKIAALKARDA